MKCIDLSEVATLAADMQPGAEPVFLTNNGRTIGAVLPITDDDVESMLLSVNPQFQFVLETSQQRLEYEGRLSSAEVRARQSLPLASE